MICCNNFIGLLSVVCLFFVSVCNTQLPTEASNSLHTGLTERIGNFSLELLYYATRDQEYGTNSIMSPITVWTSLAVIGEGASGNTRNEIFNAVRLTSKNAPQIRADYQKIIKWLVVNTETVELQKFNALFMDKENMPFKDFQNIVKEYDMMLIPADFKHPQETAKLINTYVSNFTHNRIPSIVESGDIQNSHLILTSALYFKAQWKFPFNTSLTNKEKFLDSHGKQIGEVLMMNNLATYPFAKIDALQARVIELPYGQNDRTSMIIMLPEKGVTLEKMYLNFEILTIDYVFDELQKAKEKYGEDEIELFMPRFKIETKLNLINTLERMNISDVFSESKAEMPFVSNTPTYISKVIHKAEIEVTEEGTTASGVSISDYQTRIGGIRFKVNRPFCYMIVDKITNSIAFGGFYQTPSVYLLVLNIFSRN